jgi:hypothetical protein
MVTDEEFAALKDTVASLAGLVQRLMHGEPWQPLPLPPGVTGSAACRQAWGGYAEVHVSVQVTGTYAEITGVPARLRPVREHAYAHSDVTVTMTTSGVVTMTTSTGEVAGTWMFPQR